MFGSLLLSLSTELTLKPGTLLLLLSRAVAALMPLQKLTLMTTAQNFAWICDGEITWSKWSARVQDESERAWSEWVWVERNCYFLKMLDGDNNDINKKSLNERISLEIQNDLLGEICFFVRSTRAKCGSVHTYTDTHSQSQCAYGAHIVQSRDGENTLSSHLALSLSLSQLLHIRNFLLQSLHSASDGVNIHFLCAHKNAFNINYVV